MHRLLFCLICLLALLGVFGSPEEQSVANAGAAAPARVEQSAPASGASQIFP